MLVSKAWGPEFDAQNLYKMLDMVVHTCNSSARERETAEFLGLIDDTVLVSSSPRRDPLSKWGDDIPEDGT